MGKDVFNSKDGRSIEFKNVNFSYNEKEVVLNNVSFKIKKGRKRSYSWGNRSCKTTIVNLITRFYDAQKGKIIIGGINVRDYEFESLRNKILVLRVKMFFFADTNSEQHYFV